jgi:SAM-dependent methyltransferase
MANGEQRDRNLYKLLFRSKIYSGLKLLLGKKSTSELLISRFIRPFAGAKILDLGCGPEGILEKLPPSIEYHGCDSNPRYIADAKEKFGKRGNFWIVDFNSPHIDSGNALAGGGFDIVHISAVLHHLPDESVRKLLAIAKKSIKPNGRLFCLDNVLTSQQNPIARWLILRDRGLYIRTVEKYMELFTDSWPGISYEIRTDLLRLPYTHIIAYSNTAES